MRRDLLSLSVLVAVTVLFFSPLLIGRTFSTVAGYSNSVYPWAATPNSFKSVPQTDQAELSYPWYAFTWNSVLRGDLPLWNPNSFFGEPFFSNGSSGLLYPPRLLVAYLGISPSVAHDALCIFHVLGAGIFMFLFMRRLNCGRAGALLAATAWMIGTFNLAWLHLEVVAPLAVLLPLGCWCIHHAVTSRSPLIIFLTWLVLGVTFVSGHLPFMSVVFVTVTGYGAALGARELLRDWKTRDSWKLGIPRIISFFVIPPMLAAILLVPTLYSVREAERVPPTYEQWHELMRVQPRVFLYTFWPPKGMHETAFVGLPTLFFALFALRRRRPGVALFGSLLIIVPLLALDTPLLRVAFAVLPGFGSFRYLGRLLFLWNFALAGLGGIGLDNLLTYLDSRISRTQDDALERKTIIFVCLAWFATAAHLLNYGFTVNPTFHPRQDSLLFPETPLISKLSKELGPDGRVIALSPLSTAQQWMKPMLHGATSMVRSIPSAGGYDSIAPVRTLQLIDVLHGRSPDDVIRSFKSDTVCIVFSPKTLRFDLVERLGITDFVGSPELTNDFHWPPTGSYPLDLTTVYDGPDGVIWRINGVRKGPQIVHNAVVADGPEAALKAFVSDSFDSGSVVLERGEIEGTPAPPAQTGAEDTVAEKNRGNNKLVVDTRSESAGWLLVPESWDSGWTATVNGKPEQILHADFAFRAVRIPAGQSRVEFHYWPSGLNLGISITLSAFVISLALAWYLGRAPRED